VDGQEAMDTITKWLVPLVGGKGFVRSENSEYFIRPISDGRQSIGMAISDYRPLVEVALIVTVRLHAVEHVFHLFSGVDPEYQGLSSTIITPFHYFVGGPSRIEAHRVADLLAIVGTWKEPIHAEVLAYLDSATDVVSLDRLVNVNNEILDITYPPYSFMHHIIVAKLAANPNYDNLVSFHRLEMRDMGYETELYDRLVDYLSSQS